MQRKSIISLYFELVSNTFLSTIQIIELNHCITKENGASYLTREGHGGTSRLWLWDQSAVSTGMDVKNLCFVTSETMKHAR